MRAILPDKTGATRLVVIPTESGAACDRWVPGAHTHCAVRPRDDVTDLLRSWRRNGKKPLRTKMGQARRLSRRPALCGAKLLLGRQRLVLARVAALAVEKELFPLRHRLEVEQRPAAATGPAGRFGGAARR